MHPETHAQIIDILDRVPDMSIATIRPDGFPQSTVVTFVHDDLKIYFATTTATQKARNLAACDRVSLTVTPPYDGWDVIEGLSVGGHASVVADPDEAKRVHELMIARFPRVADYAAQELGDVVLFRVDPVVISVLDYRKGFGHTQSVAVQDLIGGI